MNEFFRSPRVVFFLVALMSHRIRDAFTGADAGRPTIRSASEWPSI